MKVATLHDVATQGNLEDLTSLLDENEIDLESADQMERTALHMAAERGHKDIVALLIEKGGAILSLCM